MRRRRLPLWLDTLAELTAHCVIDPLPQRTPGCDAGCWLPLHRYWWDAMRYRAQSSDRTPSAPRRSACRELTGAMSRTLARQLAQPHYRRLCLQIRDEVAVVAASAVVRTRTPHPTRC